MEGVYEKKEGVLYEVYRCEADEMWSLGGNKANKQWGWLVIDTASRQIVAFHVGGRGQQGAWELFQQHGQAAVQQTGKEGIVFFQET